MSERERLLRRIASVDFAVTEFHIFLDTHPNNKEISDKLQEYIKRSNELRTEYESKYGPITPEATKGNNFAWISSPWPWENGKEEKSNVDV